jgi:predicted nucleic acid-binding protein
MASSSALTRLTAPRFLDTDVLLYSISRDPAEVGKREISESLLDADDMALSVQVLQEFYVQATLTTRTAALPHDIAAVLIRTCMRFKVDEITLPVMVGALEIKAAHRLPYWDATIVAAARSLGCRELLSEDMAHGREVEGVRIVTPAESLMTPERSSIQRNRKVAPAYAFARLSNRPPR